MAIVVKDRVKVTFTTTGTADFTLGSATLGFQSFAAIGNGNQTYYAAVDAITGDWEVGYGTYTTAGPTLTRTTVLSSSAAGAKVSFGAGSKDVFCTYPSEKAIYEEIAGNVLVDGGPLTVVGSGVTSYTSFSAALAELYANTNGFAQFYAQNLNGGASASTDIVAYNDLGDGTNNFIDMGIASSNYTEVAYPIFTPASGYLYNDGGELIVGTATANKDVILFAGGVALANEAVRIKGTDQSVELASDLTVAGTLSVTGAADFGSTVLLAANPTTALQAATKQYVDNQVTAGLHIHEPVLVETTGNLNATYARAGATNINIVGIANGTDISFFGPVAVNDQVYIDTATNGLLAYTAYFVVNVLSLGVAQVSLTFGGAIVTGLTNGSFTQPAVINSGVGATLTNAGTQAALTIDNVPLALTNRVMVRLQTNAAQNGVYTVTTVGTGATNWVLTRATDSDKVNPADPNGVGTGDYYYTQDGDLNAGDSHVLTTEPNTMILGYTDLTFTQFSGGVTYTGVAPIDVTGQTISLVGAVAATNGGTGATTVTTGDLLYGSATDTWSKLPLGAGYKSLLVNAAGTQVEWNAVALNQSAAVSGSLGELNGGTGQNAYTLGDTLYSSATDTLAKLAGNTTTTKKFLGQTGTGAASAAPVWQQPAATDITGLAASATTDTTNAANITSGTLPSGRISGSYTGLTGTGALAAGSLATGFTAVSAPLGGTGQSSYAVGDLLYASTSTALSKLADVAVGNALISGGVGSAPSYGKIGAATHISGTLPTANGGTGLTGFTANGVVYASSTSALATNAALTFNGTLLNNTAGTIAAAGFTSNAAGGGEGGQLSLMDPTNTTSVYSFDVSTATTGRLFTTENNTNLQIGQLAGTGGAVQLYTGGTQRAIIRSDGNVAIGTGAGGAAITLQLAKTITGNTVAYSARTTGVVQSDVTATAVGYSSAVTTAAATFTLSNLFQFRADQPSLGAGSTVTNQYGFFAASGLTGATNNYGFYSEIPAATGDWNFYAAGTADNYFAGKLGVGAFPTAATGIVLIANSATGGTAVRGIVNDMAIQSDVTSTFRAYSSQAYTAAASFTLNSLTHFFANPTAFGAGSTVTNQFGFSVSSTMTGAGTNIGFYGNLAAATNRWNTYMAGTADNWFAGNVGIGTGKSVPTTALDVAGTVTATTFAGAGTSLTGTAASLSIGGSAATLTTGRTIAITGDLAYTSGSFNGSANVTGTGTLATVNANVGSFTSASITVDAKGRITAASSGAGASPGGSTTQVQYNNAGVFAGSANLTFNGTNLTCGGTVTANSDERLKTNWRALPENFVDLLALVQSGTYDRLDVELTQDGISAQSLKPLLPNSVLADEAGTLSVAYGNAAMVAAVELAKRVVQLEAIVAKLTKGI